MLAGAHHPELCAQKGHRHGCHARAAFHGAAVDSGSGAPALWPHHEYPGAAQPDARSVPFQHAAPQLGGEAEAVTRPQ